MPRGFGDYRVKELEFRIKQLLKHKKITQKQLAEKWHLSQPSVSQKLQRMDVDVYELFAIFDITKATDEEILRVFSKEKK